MTLKNKKILITCGPTWTAIDDMRVISNRSTGELGHKLAQGIAKIGGKVTVLEGPVTVTRPLEAKSIKVLKYHFYDELFNLLKKQLLKKFDIVIHAAAVSDYQLKNTHRQKIKSGRPNLRLTLTPTKKIINEIKIISPESFLVGFKLETSSQKSTLTAKAFTLIKEAQCDLVVANGLRNNYVGYIINKEKQILAHATSRGDLSRKLIKILATKRSKT